MPIRTKNLIISLGIVALLGVLVVLLFYPGKGNLGATFGIATIFILISYFTLPLAVIALILRVARLLKANYGLPYILVGVANIIIGVIAIFLYFFYHIELTWLNKFLLNLLVGTLILSDSFLIGTVFNSKSDK